MSRRHCYVSIAALAVALGLLALGLRSCVSHNAVSTVEQAPYPRALKKKPSTSTGQPENTANKAAAPSLEPDNEKSNNKQESRWQREIAILSAIDEDDEAELEAWGLERGFYEGPSDYDSYDADTLAALASQGDIVALDRVARETLRYGQNPEGAKALYIKSVTRGSLNAIHGIIMTRLEKMNAALVDEDVEQARRMALSILTWKELGSLRGNIILPHIGRASFEDVTKDAGFTLTESDYEQARAAAEALFEALQEKRLELGLGDFNNTVPEAYKKLDLKSLERQ